MRETLLRGKRVDNGEWVVSGSLIRNRRKEGENFRYFIGGAQPGILVQTKAGHIVAAETTEECLFYEVQGDTIGQQVHLTDKDGKEAFTGDITMDTQGRKWVIFDCPGGFGTCNPWQWENHLSGDPTFLYSSLSDRQSADWFTRHNTIIGNIHDNPELLEEAEK